MRKLDDFRSPLAFLLGKTKLEKELEGLSFAPDVQPWNLVTLFCEERSEQAWETG